MTTFVILAAGRGTRMARVGGELHKALVPLDGRAIISHIIECVPSDMRLIVAVGHREDQIRTYLRLAHPQRPVEFVPVNGWDRPGGGPGHSLLACHTAISDDELYFTSCDTLWEGDSRLWDIEGSWMGVAPMPYGTHPSRWCRVVTGGRWAHQILDKTSDDPDVTDVYVGLGHIAPDDLESFWKGIIGDELKAGEKQVSNGFTQVIREHDLHVVPVDWTDVGDEQAYAQAVARYSGYDWTKLGQATYVLPRENRVVKYSADHDAIDNRRYRGSMLGNAVPKIIDHGDGMLAYQFISGFSAYDATDPLWRECIWSWYLNHFTQPVEVKREHIDYHATRFYRDKTMQRIEMLTPTVRNLAGDAVSHIDWEKLIANTEPVNWHGDFNYGNIICTSSGRIYAIDWREDFDGELEWGDMRYDIAKLIAGTVVHWKNAQRGDMRPWPEGRAHAEYFYSKLSPIMRREVDIIGALSLINSAPLHAPPLDEVLVARGCAWLERIK